MEHNSTVFRQKKTGDIIAILIILFFTVLALFRLFPFDNPLKEITDGIDDWSRYARNALDIKHNGMTIPSINGNYFSPAGFLYNYFVAFCFYLFGENPIPIYIIQSILLGFSVALIYWGFRDQMKPLTGIYFLLTLFMFALLDINIHYTFRLLSENLTLFTIAVFFYCYNHGVKKNKISLLITSSIFLGLSIMTRPNILPFGIVLIGIMLASSIKYKNIKPLHLLLFVFFLFASTSLLAIRNHFVCGSWTFFPTEGTSFGISFFHQTNFSLNLLFKKIMFCLGGLSLLEPAYQWRPHWFIMWATYFIYLFIRIRENRKFEVREITANVFIFCHYGTLLLIAPILGTYGFRLFIPCLLIILPFPFIAFDKIKRER